MLFRKGRDMPKEESESLRRLRELTPLLPSLIKAEMGTMITYEVAGGICFGHGIRFEPEYAIQKCFMSKGVVFPKHAHVEYEHLVVLSGELQCHIENMEQKIVGRGEVVTFCPGDVHECEALLDCWLLGITVPSAKGYPHE